ncbi:MAG: transporter associated domain-containing protein [Gallionella sp.]|nr:transporter associated domain-containing protein [Gallionella sp.]MDD4959831.1 transporter associated domain-containing protein [Gallionella sp.]
MDLPRSRQPTLLERLSTLLLREPEDREQLVQLLYRAYEHNLLDADALSMMEGVLQVSERQVREIMIPRGQMDVIDISQSPQQFIPFVIETAHSRFPVIDGDKDNIIGILLAKDLLRYAMGETLDVRDTLRPAIFVPESKRLNVLLRDFRSNRNHIALVVNEYGGVSGMVTIEDVLEQIVGDIEDEYDFDEDEDNIIPDGSGHYRIKADTTIEDLNLALDTTFSDQEFDTVGGLILQAAGQLPKSGDQFQLGELTFTVLHVDSRRLYALLAERRKVETL